MIASILTQDPQIEIKVMELFFYLFISKKDSNALVEASLGVHKSVGIGRLLGTVTWHGYARE